MKKNNTKTKKGDKTNVKSKIIDFSALDTEDREDDKAWNAMKLYGMDDEKEASYESPKRVSAEAKQKISSLRLRLFGARIREIYNMKVA